VLSPFYLITCSFLAKTLPGLFIEGQIHLGEAGLSRHGLNPTADDRSYEEGHLFEDLISFRAPVHGLALNEIMVSESAYRLKPELHCLLAVNFKGPEYELDDAATALTLTI
jgi:hypothetical protein